MARARSSGGGAATAWLIVFLGIGFVICLVLAIVFYTQTAELQTRADEAEENLRVYVSRDLENAPDITELANQRSEAGAVVQQLLNQNNTLKGLIGDRQMSTEQLEQRANAVMEEHDTLLRELSFLKAELEAAREQRDDARRQAEAAQAASEQAQERERQRGATYDQDVAGIRSDLEAVTEQFQAHQQRVREMEEALRSQVAEAQSSRQERVAELEATVDSLHVEREDLQRQIRDLTRRADPLDPPDIIQPDGQLASVQEQANTAYINIGRADGLVLGLTFEVFDANTTVRVGDFGETPVRGKATVEVINIGDTSSRVRVVRLARDATLTPGDQIINLIYDADAEYRFFVYGEFDVERTGSPSAADRRRVESMVTRWGGELAEDLNYGVDYLVLGQEPEVPDPLPPGEIDPVRIREHTEATRVYERYQELIARAEELSIPVLNQNRFLSLIGYYER